jgi:uncharacterized protein YacL
MGILSILGALFGGKSITDVAEVFLPNAEKSAERDAAIKAAIASQFAAEFARQRVSWFDTLIDGINRLPRPTMALGTIGLFVYAMADPVEFAARMQALAVIPDPLWWLLGAVVSFYFGARELHKFRAGKIANAEKVARVIGNMERLRAISDKPEIPDNPDKNAAVEIYRTRRME